MSISRLVRWVVLSAMLMTSTAHTEAYGPPPVAPSQLTASLGADVAMNNTSNYFDGPSVAQGSTGTWWVSGSVNVTDTAAAVTGNCKLWDGTTIIASTGFTTNVANGVFELHLSGFKVTPAGNLRISCKSPLTTSKILFNASGNSKDSTISAFRIN